MIIILGDIPYKGFTPGEVVNDPFAWPEHHDQVNYTFFILYTLYLIY